MLPKFYQPRELTRRFKIGLILHQKNNVKLDDKIMIDHSVLNISIYRSSDYEIESMIDDILCCDRIFSSSLHGLIVAQAYGIPAQWIKITGQKIHDDEDFKFYDYFLGANQEIQKPVTLDCNDALATIKFLNKVDIAKCKPMTTSGLLGSFEI